MTRHAENKSSGKAMTAIMINQSTRQDKATDQAPFFIVKATGAGI
jgi:hypothetical protein